MPRVATFRAFGYGKYTYRAKIGAALDAARGRDASPRCAGNPKTLHYSGVST
jgi:hypothetical protein